ncbi:MAG TPA: nicotinate phosphoribosyltransferase [Parachlamydiaceae bacterium]|nr:nicotinate phosphoribosyltransferase [Parachlamydiaceae bacterium]
MNLHAHNQSLALLTDLYQLTMSYGYWKAGMDNKEAVFHLFFRKRPFQGGFTITAGLEAVIDYLKKFRFDPNDLAYLATLNVADDEPLFEPAFFDYLANMKFTCSVDAVPEGNVVFPYEPLIRVQGPLIQCQLLESPLLNLVNFPTLIATKAARICIAADGDPVLEFGLRRAQGIDGSLTASRAAYIGGCEGTSNVLAGKMFGIPVRGTHSHSWIMVFDDEKEAFQTYAEQLPNNCIFLVDTYNTLEGVKKAIEVGLWLKKRGKKMLGIRLDSGDLAYLSIKSRDLLDEAGFNDAVIIASNELDETIISELKRQGAKIGVWGVGTSLVTAGNQPALDGVYKLSAIRNPGEPWKYKLKLSEQMIKISNPGILQIKRYTGSEGYITDAIYDTSLGIDNNGSIIDPFDFTRQKAINKNWTSKDLLIPIFKDGKCVYDLPSLKEIRANTQKELDQFHTGIKRFINPHEYIVGMEKSLYDLKLKLITNIRNLASQ